MSTLLLTLPFPSFSVVQSHRPTMSAYASLYSSPTQVGILACYENNGHFMPNRKCYSETCADIVLLTRGEEPMPKAACTVSLLFLILGLVGGATSAQSTQPEIVFKEDFADPTLPAWQNSSRLQSRLSPTQGPDGIPALSMEVHQPGSTTLSARLPVERIAGKAVLLDVWRKAENVTTGAQHYYNAKSMLSWKAKGVAKPQYSGTQFSDFSGTFDWERHRYVVNMPEDLEWASISIGLQACTGKAGWAGLTVSVDPRFPNQHALERFLAGEERQAFAQSRCRDVDGQTPGWRHHPGARRNPLRAQEILERGRSTGRSHSSLQNPPWTHSDRIPTFARSLQSPCWPGQSSWKRDWRT